MTMMAIYDPGGGVVVTNVLKGDKGGWLTSKPQHKDTFFVDETGKYQLRFIKRAHCDDVSTYFLDHTSNPNYPYPPGSWGTYDGLPTLSSDDIKNAPNNILLLDTIKFKKRY